MTVANDAWPIRCEFVLGGVSCGRPATKVALTEGSCGCAGSGPGCADCEARWPVGRSESGTCSKCGAPMTATIASWRPVNEGDLP